MFGSGYFCIKEVYRPIILVLPGVGVVGVKFPEKNVTLERFLRVP